MRKYRVLGVMSGSSLDGLDFCLAEFMQEGSQWTYLIVKYLTIDFPQDIISRLNLSSEGQEVSATDIYFGKWIGHQINEHFQTGDFEMVGIHGHTTQHNPTENVSRQIGSAKEISKITGKVVVDNFRIQDIIKGGQGAPLVPVGEHYLFPSFKAFLNLGGICNGSVHQKDKIIAWDIAPCNQVLNFFAKKLGLDYDKGGQIANKGVIDKAWLQNLYDQSYFKENPPKSIGNHWVKAHFLNPTIDPRDGLATFTAFLGKIIAADFNRYLKREVIHVAGGGAFNTFLIDNIRKNLHHENQLLIPDVAVIDNKEALIFGFLGLLRTLNIENVYASVTGASSNTIAGDIHHPTIYY
ncbi:MAG: anhydro-N-acetylmuramic acid kinase [Cyclobacteriaceae bacterium]